MTRLTQEEQRTRVLALLREGRLGREAIAAEVGVSPATVSAIKAHLTMGNYADARTGSGGREKGTTTSSAVSPARGDTEPPARPVAAGLTASVKMDPAPASPVVCGLDGCPGGWVGVWHDLGSGEVWWQVAPTLLDVATVTPSPAVIGIDIPIGLVASGSRECDRQARRLLGLRKSSVFPAPIRPLLAARSWEEAGTLRRALEGKGLSRQAWAISPKICEVDEALRADPALRERVREVHPELSFAFMNEERPMSSNKKSPEGRRQRLEVLRAQFGEVVDEALTTKPPGCAVDDLLDAFAAAWTAARIARGQACSIPAEPHYDEHGLRMEMVM